MASYIYTQAIKKYECLEYNMQIADQYVSKTSVSSQCLRVMEEGLLNYIFILRYSGNNYINGLRKCKY